MKKQFIAVAATSLLLLASSVEAQSAEIIGTWRGTSICADKKNYPACNDEQVIYDVVPSKAGKGAVTLSADKVVNGVREFMAAFDFTRTADSSWVTDVRMNNNHFQIVLRIKGTRMSGALTDLVYHRKVRDLSLARVRAAGG